MLVESRKDIGVDDNDADEEDEDDHTTSGLVLELRSRGLRGDGILEIFDAE